MRKLVLRCLSVALIISILSMPMSVSANDDVNSEVNEISLTEEITITEENIQSVIANYDVPREVADSLISRINNGNSGDVLTLLVPVASNEDTSAYARSTTSSWSPIRIYEGHQLTDWVITIRNSHSPTSITSDATENNVLAFVGSLLAFTGGVLLKEIPLFGAFQSAFEFILGLETNEISPSSGDILTAAPQYLCYETFTYVVVSGEYYMGAHTYAAYVQQITWFAYYAAEHKQDTKITGATEAFESENYSNRSRTAVQWYSLGGLSDPPVYITLGDCEFLLN